MRFGERKACKMTPCRFGRKRFVVGSLCAVRSASAGQDLRDEGHDCRRSTTRRTSLPRISPPRSSGFRRPHQGRGLSASQLGSIPRQIEGVQFGAIQAAVIPPEFFVGVDERFEVMAAPGLVES
jgi:hypothetical protein